MKIAIDLDKTLFDCKSKLYDMIARVEHLIPRPEKTPRVIDKEGFDSKNVKARNIFGKIGNPEFYSEIDGAVGFINELAKDGNQIVFLSSRPNMRTMNNVVLTWLEKYNVDYDFLVVSCTDKAKFCTQHGIGLLIDDGMRNCLKATEAGVSSIHLDHKGKYNTESELFVKNKKLYNAKNWQGVYKIANKLIDKEKSEKINNYSGYMPEM